MFPSSSKSGLIIVGALLTLIELQAPVRAQSNAFGNRASGGRTAGNQSTLSGAGVGGQQNAFGNSFGQSGTNAGGVGGMAGGQANGQTGVFGQAAMLTPGQTGIGGQNGQRNFVGRDANDVRSNFENQLGQPRSGGGFNDILENLNEMRESRRRWREQQSTPPPVRVRLVPSFDLPVAEAPAAFQTKVQGRLSDSLVRRGINPAQVTFNGRDATVTGSVSSERERDLIARLLSLEPGVGKVDNRLSVDAK